MENPLNLEHVILAMYQKRAVREIDRNDFLLRYNKWVVTV